MRQPPQIGTCGQRAATRSADGASSRLEPRLGIRRLDPADPRRDAVARQAAVDEHDAAVVAREGLPARGEVLDLEL
jgi:hypothetical protein